MKYFFVYLAFLGVAVVALPLAMNVCLHGAGGGNTDMDDAAYTNVYFASEDEVVHMKTEDYIRGVLMAEMPAEFEFEALKAQAVAARTYMVQKASVAGAIDEHKGADVCTDSSHCQAYVSDDDAKTRWGKNASRYFKKCKNAVEETDGIIAVFGNEPIKAVFHAVSGGRTENAADVWGSDVEYLRSVDSPGEENAPKYVSEVRVGVDEFRAKLANSHGVDFGDKLMGTVVRSEGGNVKTIELGNKTIKGTEVRAVFGLNSSGFDVRLEGDEVVFDVRGYGHGVGMSQYGANYLAGQGYGYKEILKKYYNGIGFASIYE